MQAAVVIWMLVFALGLAAMAWRRLSALQADAEALVAEFGGDIEGARGYLRATGWVAAVLAVWCVALAYWVAAAHPV